MRTFSQTLFTFLLCACLASPGAAQMYKYQDESGRWHFSDKPPTTNNVDVELLDQENIGKSTSSNIPKDLATKLSDRFPANTPVQKITQAVVSVESKLGIGTGFFISNDGYLITNKHVVQPTKTSDWKTADSEFKKRIAELDAYKKELTYRAKELEVMRKELEEYKKEVSLYSGSRREIAQDKLEIYTQRYQDQQSNYNKAARQEKKARKELKKNYSDFRFASNSARISKRFKITLKDNTKLTAQLLAVGKKHDLALLKINGYTTPYIDLDTGKHPTQGDKVFAIGSPLGMKDFVTSGVVTNISNNEIAIDAQILPGNSGGPLIDHEGNLLGINTQKLMAAKSIGSAGFGVAIPIRRVYEEFGRFINPQK